jgi:hypothetical protein
VIRMSQSLMSCVVVEVDEHEVDERVGALGGRQLNGLIPHCRDELAPLPRKQAMHSRGVKRLR